MSRIPVSVAIDSVPTSVSGLGTHIAEPVRVPSLAQGTSWVAEGFWGETLKQTRNIVEHRATPIEAGFYGVAKLISGGETAVAAAAPGATPQQIQAKKAYDATVQRISEQAQKAMGTVFNALAVNPHPLSAITALGQRQAHELTQTVAQNWGEAKAAWANLETRYQQVRLEPTDNNLKRVGGAASSLMFAGLGMLSSSRSKMSLHRDRAEQGQMMSVYVDPNDAGRVIKEIRPQIMVEDKTGRFPVTLSAQEQQAHMRKTYEVEKQLAEGLPQGRFPKLKLLSTGELSQKRLDGELVADLRGRPAQWAQQEVNMLTTVLQQRAGELYKPMGGSYYRDGQWIIVLDDLSHSSGVVRNNHGRVVRPFSLATVISDDVFQRAVQASAKRKAP